MVRLSQGELARLAGVHRNSVSYWENKGALNMRSNAPKKIALALDESFSTYSPSKMRCGRQAVSRQDWFEWGLAKRSLRKDAGISRRNSTARVRCNAKTRKGTSCRNLSEAGRRRCKFHGGMSTGPRTIEGRERIAKAQRRRWANGIRFSAIFAK